LAVVPYVDHGLDEEDRPLRIPVDEPPRAGKLHVGAVLSPRVANTEDLFPLLGEPDVQLTWLTRNDLARQQDLLVLPGSKATVADLAFHVSTGMADSIVAAHARGAWVLGLCGGYQMLGTELRDDAGTEGGPRTWSGLGLLPVMTVFQPSKTTAPRTFDSEWPEAGHVLTGYEIHHGRTSGDVAALMVGTGAEVGAWGERVVGAYLHGLLASDGWRAAFLNRVRRHCGRPQLAVTIGDALDLRIQRWAAHVRSSFLPGAWERIRAAVSLR
jgi:adenosylcobyric acid synthase